MNFPRRALGYLAIWIWSATAAYAQAPSGVRLLASIVVAGAAFFLGLAATGAIGLNDAAHVQMPIAAFLATIALWPLLPKDTAATRNVRSWIGSLTTRR